MTPTSKLYVIVKAALDSGLKAAQAIHAYKAFSVEHPEIDKSWFEVSSNIVVLEYDALEDLADRLERHGLALARFHEPDRGGDLTAICVEPQAQRKVSNIPLARGSVAAAA